MSLSNCLKIWKGEGIRTPPRSNMMARASGAVTPGGVASPDVLEASVPGAGKMNGDDDDDKAHRLVLEVKLDPMMTTDQ